jgi:hypothetical protein
MPERGIYGGKTHMHYMEQTLWKIAAELETYIPEGISLYFAPKFYNVLFSLQHLY